MVNSLEKNPSAEIHGTACKNCDKEVSGKYCINCGQAANTHKLNVHFILHDLQHGLFHFDKGILYTGKRLIKRPGHTIRDFIEGKRVKHIPPFSFVVIVATFYGLLYHYLVFNHASAPFIAKKDSTAIASEKVVVWITEHFAFDCLFIILSATVACYLVFKKERFNIIEHLVLNTYLIGLFIEVCIFLFPIVNIWGNTASLFYGVILQFLLLILMCWCYVQFFNSLPKIKVLALSLVVFLITSVINLTIGFLASWIVMYLG